jgi:parvulin-like peptidyl-prolyl isomerase
LMTKDESKFAAQCFNFMVDEIKEPFAFQGGYSIARVNRRDPPHQKTFAEARQEVASQYQDERAQELRTEWVEELRTEYDRQINEQALTAEWTKQHSAEQGDLLKN